MNVSAKTDKATPRYRIILDITKDVLTIAAILVGGAWSYMLFVQHRDAYPKLKISPKVAHRKLSAEKTLLLIDFGLENSGTVMIRPLKAQIQLFQVLPLTDTMKKALSNADFIPNDRRDANWPRIGFRLDPYGSGMFLEPGESTSHHYEFIVPSFVQTVNVVVFYSNLPTLNGWESVFTYDLQPAVTK